MTGASKEIFLLFIPEGPEREEGLSWQRAAEVPVIFTGSLTSKLVHNEQESKYKSQLSPWRFPASGIRHPALSQAVKDPLSCTISWSITPGNDQPSNASTSLRGSPGKVNVAQRGKEQYSSLHPFRAFVLARTWCNSQGKGDCHSQEHFTQ